MTNPLRRSYFWLVYLALVWVPFFVVPVHLIQLPLCILGFFWTPAWGAATRFNRLMFRFVLALQPWYRADLSIGLPVRVQRLEQGCLVVSNHRSHLDVFLLFHELTHLRIVAKLLLFFMPLFGHMMVLLRMIPVRNNSATSYLRAMARVRAALARHQRVLVFPESTRCAPGALRTGRFQRAPFHAAREAGVPVVPVAIWGTDEIWAKGSQRITLGRKAWARSLPPIDSRAFSDAESLALHVQSLIDNAVLALREQALRAEAASP